MLRSVWYDFKMNNNTFPTDELGQIVSIILPILKSHGVCHASVFGSFARGEQSADSDLDLMIEYDTHVSKSLLKMARLKNELEERIKRSVDLVTPKGLHENLRQYVEKDLVGII